ncbi:hypothetical protein BV210_12670 [Halorientalis sp. IM1011]|uniref:hypothetical protein n=1 Tax=Halorientalis sp. IM1011 TaxID=1932360 RepID=UPI00097CCE11|nr:hypothetical protein [Halorientalis sp. IM1011]AQL43494.1 hypothetical protein BV210_12670 [Halorientalis sp. IM1011]
MRRVAIALLVGGTLALAVLATPAAGAQTETNTNQTVVGAEIDGWSATGIDFEGDRANETIRQEVAANLSLEPDQVRLLPENSTIEVYGDDLSAAGVADGLAAAGFSPNVVRKGVTDRTRNAVVDVLRARLAATGVGGEVETINADGTQYVTVVGADRAAVTQQIRNRGRVEVFAHYPVTEGSETTYRQTKILENEDFIRVGEAAASRPFTDRPTVEVFLEVESAREAAGIVKEAGFTDEGVTGCPDDAAQNPDAAEGHCIFTYFNGDIVSSRSLGGGLAWAINFQEYEEDPSVFLITETVSEAEQLSMTLRTGAYPVPLSMTDLPESVRTTALERAANSSGDELPENPNQIPVATPDDSTPDDTPESTTPTTDEPTDSTTEATADTPTDEPADNTTAATTTDSDGVVAVTDATGPGFSPISALLALVLGTTVLLAARRS